MAIRQICDRCGHEGNYTTPAVPIKEKYYQLCPKCFLEYEALVLACQIKTESALFQWVNKEVK